MPHAELGSLERHQEPVAAEIVLVGREPVKRVVEGHAPGIAAAAADDREVFSAGVAPQDPAAGVAVGGELVARPPRRRPLFMSKRDRLGVVHRAYARLDLSQVAEGPRGVAEDGRVALAEIEEAVGSEGRGVEGVLERADPSGDPHVFVGRAVAVGVAGDREIGGVGHPKFRPPRSLLPGHPLYAVERAGERLRRVERAVAVGVDEHHDRVARRVLPRVAILRSHRHEEPAAGVEGEHRDVPHKRLAGRHRGHESGGHDRQRGRIGARDVEAVAPDLGGEHARKQAAKQARGRPPADTEGTGGSLAGTRHGISRACASGTSVDNTRG